VTKQNTHSLKVFSEPTALLSPPAVAAWHGPAPLAALCSAFSVATGCRLEFVASGTQTAGAPTASPANLPAWSAPVDPGDGAALGHFKIADRDSGHNPQQLHAVVELASLVSELVNQLSEAREAIRSSTAELAAQAPNAIYTEQSVPLGKRIESVLQGAVAALDCAAAGMYLLDDETTELRLRGMWGLSRARLATPARPLEGATADLEAMLGHAVVLSDDSLFDLWRVPEPDFGAAVCVPISSATSILGTFWIYSREARDFEDRETNLLEILAGRLAMELEQAALLRKCRPAIRTT
jgi:hypothetical protein